jgi:hypothetical protein
MVSVLMGDFLDFLMAERDLLSRSKILHQRVVARIDLTKARPRAGEPCQAAAADVVSDVRRAHAVWVPGGELECPPPGLWVLVTSCPVDLRPEHHGQYPLAQWFSSHDITLLFIGALVALGSRATTHARWSRSGGGSPCRSRTLPAATAIAPVDATGSED